MHEGSQDRRVAVGRIGRPKGLKGELFVDSYNSDSTLLGELSRVFVGKSAETAQPLGIERAVRHNARLVVTFTGVTDRNGAEALTHSEVFALRSEFPELPSGEHYCCDVIGLEVVSGSGKALGTLESVLNTASNDIYVVKGPEGELLVPAIAGVVKSVNLKEGKIVLDPPEVADAV